MKPRWFNGVRHLSFAHGAVQSVTDVVERPYSRKLTRRPGAYKRK